MVDIITARQEIGKFFYKYGFGDILSSVPQNRLAEMISSLAVKGNQSRTTDFAELKQGFRTTYGYFLAHGKWDEEKISQKHREESFRKAAELAQEKQVPLYLSIDDTVIEKKKPSSTAHGGNRLALFPSGGQAGIWLSGVRRQYQCRRYFSVLLSAPLLSGERLQN